MAQAPFLSGAPGTANASAWKGITPAPAELARLMTLLMLLAFTDEVTRATTPVRVAALVGMVWPSVRRSWILWLTCAAMLAVRHLLLWHTLDNHQWLLTYWVLVMTLASLTRSADAITVVGARRLVAVCFALATLWKLLSAEFRDGTFFTWAILGGDPRFGAISRHIVGLTPATLEGNRVALERALSTGVPVALSGATATMRAVARLLTGWTLLIEVAIAVAFSLPARNGCWQHVLLLLFVSTTYLLAPVIGFAWVLLAIGVACLPDDAHRLRFAYALTFVLLPLTALPHVR